MKFLKGFRCVGLLLCPTLLGGCEGFFNLRSSATSLIAGSATSKPEGITISSAAVLATTEAGGTASFTVVLDRHPTAEVRIPVSTSDPSEGALSASELIFTPANWNSAQTVTVTGVDDALADGAVSYTVVIAAAISADVNYHGLDPEDLTITNSDDDSAGITVSPSSGLTTTEAGGSATFSVVLNTAPLADVIIAIASNEATEGTVSPTSLTFTAANWNSAQTVTVTGVNDALPDGNVSYNIVTSAATSSDSAYNGVDPADVSVSNSDDDTAGITVSPSSGLSTTEAGGSATFTIVLNSEPSADVVVALSSSDTTEGTVSPASLTFTAGNWNSAQTVTVTGVNDASVDGNIAYTIITAAATSADSAYNGIDPSNVSVSNTDNDSAGITVNPTSGLTTTEAGGTATFTVVLNTEPSANVTIGISSNDSTEGTVSPASLTFTTGNWNSAQTVTVTGVNDALADGNIAYTITTAAATSADSAYNGINPIDVSVTNSDNDTAGITVSPTSGLTTTEAGGAATFTVVLNSEPTASVVIGLSSSDTTEGTVSPASLTFTTGNWNSAQTVTITGVNDALVDGNIAYTITTAAATSADSAYNGLDPSNVSVTNSDNDSIGITVNPASGLTTTEAGGTATFTVVLNSEPSASVVIGLSSSDTTEGTVSPASLTFTTGNWNSAQTVTITGVNDALVDGNIAYTITTAAATSADSAYNGLDPSNVSVTNSDNDAVGITVNPTSGLTTTEAGGTATFTVVLNSEPTASVVIGLSSSDTTEGTVSPASLTFTTGNWNIAQTVTVTGVNDALADGNIAYSITTAAATSADGAYNGIDPSNVSVTNSDNDTAGITVNPTSGLTTTEAGGTATFTVVLNSEPTASVSIGLSSSDTTEGTVSPASLTFTTGNWNSAQTVTVTGVNDALTDGNIAYSITTAAATSADGAYNGIDPSNVSASNTDDDSGGASITVTAPNGSEFFVVHTTRQVTWTSSGVTGNVDISLSYDSGSSWVLLSSEEANDGTFDLFVPNNPSSYCRIMVTDSNTGSILDESNADFTIDY